MEAEFLFQSILLGRAWCQSFELGRAWYGSIMLGRAWYQSITLGRAWFNFTLLGRVWCQSVVVRSAHSKNIGQLIMLCAHSGGGWQVLPGCKPYCSFSGPKKTTTTYYSSSRECDTLFWLS